MRKTGIDLRMEAAPAKIERRADGSLHVTLRDGVELDTDAVMYATGRLPRTKDLGLEALGVKLGARGEILVDEYSQSSVPGIHAIGDVTDRIALTPVALHEAMCLSATLFKGVPTKPDHHNVPACVFSQPPVGAVGCTEAVARERYGEVDIYRSRFKELKHTLSGRDQQAMMKLVVDPKSDRVLGAHMVGSYAGEIIQGIAVAIRCGATKAQFDATLGIHPTSAEEFVTMRERAKQ
jgi:glutathione reductase (NADPH)